MLVAGLSRTLSQRVRGGLGFPRIPIATLFSSRILGVQRVVGTSYSWSIRLVITPRTYLGVDLENLLTVTFWLKVFLIHVEQLVYFIFVDLHLVTNYDIQICCADDRELTSLWDKDRDRCVKVHLLC